MNATSPHRNSTPHPPTTAYPMNAWTSQAGGGQGRAARSMAATGYQRRFHIPFTLVSRKSRRVVRYGTTSFRGKRMLERLARWSYRHRWKMLIMWVIALVGITTLGSVAGGDYASDFSLPGAE